jgi:putative NADH-flavin reductase
MKITVFGATGGTGRLLVEQALAAGHEVTVVVRDPARLTIRSPAAQLTASPASGVLAGNRLHVITADVMNPAAISDAVAGADAVLTAIGPRSSGATTVSADSAASIIAAMRRNGVRRLITVSGSIVADAGEGAIMSHLVKPLLRRTFLKDACIGMRRGEEVVRASRLDWTIVRPPRLTDKPATGRYRTALDRNLPRGLTVSRADVAAYLLKVIDDQAAVHHIVGIAN